MSSMRAAIPSYIKIFAASAVLIGLIGATQAQSVEDLQINKLEIQSYGEVSNYTLATSGHLRAGLLSEETVKNNSVNGQIGPLKKKDNYFFLGDLERLTLKGSGAVNLNGEELISNGQPDFNESGENWNDNSTNGTKRGIHECPPVAIEIVEGSQNTAVVKQTSSGLDAGEVAVSWIYERHLPAQKKVQLEEGSVKNVEIPAKQGRKLERIVAQRMSCLEEEGAVFRPPGQEQDQDSDIPDLPTPGQDGKDDEADDSQDQNPDQGPKNPGQGDENDNEQGSDTGDKQDNNQNQQNDEEELPNTVTLLGWSIWEKYSFEVTGDIEKSEANGATINPYDKINGGKVEGRVYGGKDSYRFSGEIKNMNDGKLTVLVNGEKYSPENNGQDSGTDQQDEQNYTYKDDNQNQDDEQQADAPPLPQ